jgi:DNA-binding NarL/FixJ family response regulator
MTMHNERDRGHERCFACEAMSRAPCYALCSHEIRRDMRLSAMATDASSTCMASLAGLWQELARGDSIVVDDFFSTERCYLVVAPRRAEPAQRVEGRRLAILQAVMAGLPQTNVAIDLSLAPSTVAVNTRLGLECLGVWGKASRSHPLLMLAAMAATQPSATTARASAFVVDDHQLRVIGASRPERHLAGVLPGAELAVIRRLVEGWSHAEIARERGTSTRTIANQIAAVFRRLSVSGRNELLQRLLVDEGLIHPLPKPLAETQAAPESSSSARRDPWRDTLRSA